MCECVGCAILLYAVKSNKEGLNMPDSLENLKTRSDAYLSVYHDAVRYVQGKVQDMHDKEFYALVHMYKGKSEGRDRIRKAFEIAQLEKVLEVLEGMK